MAGLCHNRRDGLGKWMGNEGAKRQKPLASGFCDFCGSARHAFLALR